MSNKKNNNKKPFFRLVHLEAVLLIVLYSIISKTVFVESVSNNNILVSFFGPFIFGITSTFLFLHFFNHEDFFHFAKDLEDEEKKKEKRLLDRFRHHKKVFTTIIVGLIGGCILLALTVRLLLNNFAYKYLVIIVTIALSTLIGVGTAKGLFNLL